MKRDKNYKSYEDLSHELVDVGVLNPYEDGWTEWADTMKTFQCEQVTFYNGVVTGGEEDVLDVGTHTSLCEFDNFHAHPHGSQYIITLKSGSCGNGFIDWHLHDHGHVCDIQQGNWSDQDNGPNDNNAYIWWTAADGKPITYSYRFFSKSKPIFVGTETKHLWWLSLGITVYFWAKWLFVKLFK